MLSIFVRRSGLLKYLWRSKMLLRWIEEMSINLVVPDLDGKLLETVPVRACIDSRFLARGTLKITFTPPVVSSHGPNPSGLVGHSIPCHFRYPHAP